MIILSDIIYDIECNSSLNYWVSILSEPRYKEKLLSPENLSYYEKVIGKPGLSQLDFQNDPKWFKQLCNSLKSRHTRGCVIDIIDLIELPRTIILPKALTHASDEEVRHWVDQTYMWPVYFKTIVK